MNMKFKKFTACLMATASLVTGMVGMSASAADMPDAPKNYGNTSITSFTVPPCTMDWRKYTGDYAICHHHQQVETPAQMP